MRFNLSLLGIVLLILGVIGFSIVYIYGGSCLDTEYINNSPTVLCSTSQMVPFFSLIFIFVGTSLVFIGIFFKPTKKNKKLTLEEIILLIFLILLFIWDILFTISNYGG